MKQIVSANYFDRESDSCWLARPEDQNANERKHSHKALSCTNVTFQPSSAREEGFGCRIVAVCDTAKPYKLRSPKKLANRLRFTGYNFKDSETSEEILTCSKLHLHPNGTMTYEP